ncbi:hypothetical protein FPOA_00986 [Fusarium poae]|uniref:Uncharacterized protein n=1 Tax=Fusarium poae TaxID=36050 RepID=A0A1B8B2V2_FUSPO|nr:hypothetical protein FPOA_00986 [Fusarium poae]
MSISLSVWNPRRSITNNHVSATSRKRSVRMQRDLIDHTFPRKTEKLDRAVLVQSSTATTPQLVFHDVSDISISNREERSEFICLSSLVTLVFRWWLLDSATSASATLPMLPDPE